MGVNGWQEADLKEQRNEWINKNKTVQDKMKTWSCNKSNSDLFLFPRTNNLKHHVEHKSGFMCLLGSSVTLYLLWEVIPVDVVAVGVSPWTLDVYPMTLQDCGFL